MLHRHAPFRTADVYHQFPLAALRFNSALDFSSENQRNLQSEKIPRRETEITSMIEHPSYVPRYI
jgi:hypothetical protein